MTELFAGPSTIQMRLDSGRAIAGTAAQLLDLIGLPIISLKSPAYGATGDGVTDDTAAVTLAEAAIASDSQLIVMTEGSYILSGIADLTGITKNYSGAGKLTTADGNSRANNIIRMLSAPTFDVGTSIVNDFNGDFLSPWNTEVLVAGDDTVGDPATGYFQAPQVSPFYTRAFFSAGKENSPFGDDGRTGWAVYDTRISHLGQADAVAHTVNVFVGAADSRQFVAIKGTTGAGTFSVDEVITDGTSGATGTAKSVQVQGGDTIIHMEAPTTGTFALTNDVSGTSGATATNLSYVGPTDAQGAPTGLVLSGSVTAGADNVFLNTEEILLKDNGFDVGALGIIRDFNRTNDTAAREQFWYGSRMQSFGTKDCDVVHQAVGKWRWGIDFTAATFTTAAISLAADQEIHFNETAQARTLAAGFHLWPSTPSGTKMYYKASASAITFEVAGTSLLDIAVAKIDYKTSVSTTGVYQVAGTQVLGARIATWTATTGTEIRTNFGDASLSDTSQALRALIVDLKSTGVIGDV